MATFQIGSRATTHWAFTELLPLVGATHEKARVVRDGSVITAGGRASDAVKALVAERYEKVRTAFRDGLARAVA